MTSELREEFDQYLKELSTWADPADLQGFSECFLDFEIVSCLQDNPRKKAFLLRRGDGTQLVCKYACGEYQPMLQTENEIFHLKKFSFLPYVIACRETGEGTFLLREYIEGQTLCEAVEDRGPMSLPEAIPIMEKICDSLAAFHRMDPPLIYRDLKPANIVLTPDGDCYFVDTGAMRCYQEDGSEDTVCMGTKGFAAPEQFGLGQSDARTDIYAAGVLFHYLLTGESKPTKESLTGLPAKASALILKCTQLHPDDRYQDMKCLKKALAALTPDPKRRGLKIWACAATAGLFLVSCICAILVWNPEDMRILPRRKAVFNSALLERAVREELGKTDGEPVYMEDLAEITQLLICGNVPFHDPALHQTWERPHRIDGVSTEGPGDVSDLSLLAAMPNLRVLMLENQKISDLSPLRGLMLTELYLQNNPVADLSPLAECSSLTYLDVSYTAVNSLDALADCRALTNLDCSNSSVVSLEPLKRFSLNWLSMENIPARDYEELELLQISTLKCSNVTPDILGSLQKMNSLQSLYLTNCSIRSLEAFADFPALTDLHVPGCGLRDLKGIEKLPELQGLELTDNPIRDGSALTCLHSVRCLTVWSTGITDFTFINEMPSIDSLVISDMQVPYLERDVPNRWFSLLQDNN